MGTSDIRRLKKAILEVVRAQLRENDPPETKQTLERLLREGFTEEEALKLIGYVAAAEVFAVIKEERPYNEKKYLAALQALPKMPWDTD
jgi:uncharacterized protein with ATP-grasp and redox domains